MSVYSFRNPLDNPQIKCPATCVWQVRNIFTASSNHDRRQVLQGSRSTKIQRLKKWQQAWIPLLACLFVEILSPAKVLSLAFQDSDIDTVSSIQRLEAAKKQLERLERKRFEDLPTVKRFLEKVEERDGAFLYQNVALHSFQTAKESAKVWNSMLLRRIKEAMQTRMEVAENKYVFMATTVLNCEGWERKNEDGEEDDGFADDSVTELFQHFQEPLLKAGLDGSLNSLLEQWHDLVAYTERYLDPSRTPYLRVWRRIFHSSQKDEWSMVLLLVELLFSIPISNAKVERLFSLMNHVKTDSWATLGEDTLNHLIRIRMEGPPFEEYDPTPAIQLWASSASRRPNQRRRKHYKARESAKRGKVLIDGSSTEESSDSEEDGERALISNTVKLCPHSFVSVIEFSDKRGKVSIMSIILIFEREKLDRLQKLFKFCFISSRDWVSRIESFDIRHKAEEGFLIDTNFHKTAEHSIDCK